MNPQLTWNLITDVQQMWAYPFMVTALRAGTVVAVLAGVVGWVMVLRKESFAGHTLAVVGFPGAAAAAWLGVATGYGYFAACIGAAAAIALLPAPTRAGGLGGFSEESAGIGTIQALALATGFLFVSLYHGFLSGLTSLLFGTIAGVSSQQLDVLLIAALACLIVLAAIGRPLLWASIDPDAAAVNGVPTRLVAGAVPAGARRRRGRCQPDHRQPLGVRAAGGPARGRLPLHRPSRDGHCHLGPHRGRRDLGRYRLRVLFAVSDRVLGEQFRVRHLSAGRRLPSERRADPPADRPTALPGSPRGGGMTIIDGRASASGPLTGFANMLGHPFITHALVAGTAVALVCGLVGYFLVLRGQVFAGDAQGHIAYTGAMAALVAGLDPRVGLFAATIMAGVALGVISRRGADDVAIGSFFSWILGLGALFLTYYTTHGSGNNGTANVNVLFGSIFGINDQARTLAVAVAAGVGVVLIVIARPLLFATIDPAVAQAAGVPTRLLSTLFLVIVGVTVAEATQIIGALVVLGLLAAPAAAAARLTTRPWHGFWLSAVLATAAIWIGVTIAYAVPAAPATFTIMSTAATIYLIAAVISARGRQPRLALAAP